MTIRRALLVTVLAILIGANGFFAWLGYFGSATFVPIPATAARKPFAAVLLSGDLGLKVGMGREVAERLAADGVPVMGINTLQYFRHRRTPAETTALIADGIRRAMAFGHVGRVALIGQSFGADMLQVGATALPSELRARVMRMVLVVPGDTVAMRTSPSELYGPLHDEGPALPTARTITWVPLLCVHGAEETDSLCPLLTQPNARDVPMPGGHPMHRDADAVHAAIARFLLPRDPS